MSSKVEQEQRAIRAEETLRKTRSQNASTAKRIQEEFRRLSVQLATTFEANEKLAAKSLAERNELRLQKFHLEEAIKKASAEHQSVKTSYEDSLSQLASQVKSMANQIEKMQNSVKEMESLVEQGNKERTVLENRITSLENDAKNSEKELNKMRCLLEEKESIVWNLQAELDSLHSQYDEIKHSLSEHELKNEELREKVSQLKEDLKKNEDALRSMEKKMKDLSSCSISAGGGRIGPLSFVSDEKCEGSVNSPPEA
ncbi:hypothetical protein SASPL_147793 [Salvia splendens]|uniref:Uncharacterized protein n=1 Tax=Salvia splendens TaxID=180675 RepID=A0A8X8WF41_SALSN|nr:hypothetical protein SASPL_147793 [Salvia splendens]